MSKNRFANLAKYLCLAVSAGSFVAFCPVVSAQSTAVLNNQKQTTGSVLKGSLVFSERMPPMPKNLRPGELWEFKKEEPKLAKEEPLKFAIPAWLVGVWQRTQINEISRTSLTTGQKLKPLGLSVAKVNDTFGTYRDKTGQVWQVFFPDKSEVAVDRGPVIDWHKVRSYQLADDGHDSVVIKVQAMHAVVSKTTKRIVSAFQDEEVNKYSLLKNGKLQTDSRVKVFDLLGIPKYETRSLSEETRLKAALLTQENP